MDCKECDITFEPTGRNQKYCSNKCRDKASNRRKLDKHCVERGYARMEGLCKVCGTLFSKEGKRSIVFCSDNCRSVIATKRAEKLKAKKTAKPSFQCIWCKKTCNRKNTSKYCSRNCLKEASRCSNYDLSRPEFIELKQASNDICEICNERPATCIDHCHDTGKVRGLVCNKCNSGLGLLGDNLDSLMAAVNYLKKR